MSATIHQQADRAPEPFVATAEIAELLGVSMATVRRMTAAGMPSHILMSRTRRYRASEVTAWVEARNVPANVIELKGRRR